MKEFFLPTKLQEIHIFEAIQIMKGLNFPLQYKLYLQFHKHSQRNISFYEKFLLKSEIISGKIVFHYQLHLLIFF